MTARALRHLLIGGIAGRRPAIVLAVALAVAALVLLLSRPPATLGQGVRAGCASSTAQPTRGLRACATRGHKTHARPKAKKHHLKRTAAKKKAKSRSASPSAPHAQPPATCEDATTPVRGSDGSYSCEDGSEPECASGPEPTPSSGFELLCPAESDPATTPAICEDESAPLRGDDGSYSCEDGSEPECEDGSSPTLSSDSTLVCVAPPATEPPAEEFDSDGTSMRVSSAS
jgi:hypothetical protein